MNRRAFIRTSALAASALVAPAAYTQNKPAGLEGKTYEDHMEGIRILPGAWRPHYPWEHIAWVSPPWPSQDYAWLDFPEAIFTTAGLQYLSHINPPIDMLFYDLPRVPWKDVENGIAFERELPNRVSFGGSVTRRDPSTIALELHITNGTSEPLQRISLQTCAFLRAIKEFADYTTDNKFVHVPGKGWITFTEAKTIEGEGQPYRIGWRWSGKAISDLPIMLTKSNAAERYAGMTWLDDTLSMVSNYRHPCMHADPKIPDIAPGETKRIQGLFFFHDGPLAEFQPEKIVGAAT